ncbi:MAG: hypothetical protein HYV97_10650 [Bdellovibrio sp.]|nr:hypothetical protein [Bdellovibrio sp.]
MKNKLFIIAILFCAMNVSALERPNSLWGQCRPSAHVDQKFTLHGIEIDLTGTAVKLDVEGVDLVLKQGQLEIVLGHAKEFDLKACHNRGLTGFSERFQLAQDVTLTRKESVGICRPKLFGLPYTGYGLDWSREVAAQYLVQATEGMISIKGKGTEWYSTLSDCLERK